MLSLAQFLGFKNSFNSFEIKIRFGFKPYQFTQNNLESYSLQSLRMEKYFDASKNLLPPAPAQTHRFSAIAARM